MAARIRVMYQMEDLEGVLRTFSRSFKDQKELNAWQSLMVRGSVAKGRAFEIIMICEGK